MLGGRLLQMTTPKNYLERVHMCLLGLACDHNNQQIHIIHHFSLQPIFLFARGHPVLECKPSSATQTQTYLPEKRQWSRTSKAQSETGLSEKRPGSHALVRLKIWSQHDTSAYIQASLANSFWKVESGGTAKAPSQHLTAHSNLASQHIWSL